MRNILKCLKQFDWFLTIYKNDAYRKLILAIESLREFIGNAHVKRTRHHPAMELLLKEKLLVVLEEETSIKY